MAEKTNPEKVLEMVNKVYPKLVDAENKNVALFNSVKTSATANKGKSYWNGSRAFAWYCSTCRACANAHFRIARIADIYKQICDDAMLVQSADKKKSTAILLDLHTKYIRFSDLKSRCESNYSKVISWGKS